MARGSVGDEMAGEQLPIAGTRLRALRTLPDARGSLTELFREAWATGVVPLQWNFVRSERNVLRGVHVHPRHDDYLIVLSGRVGAGMRDLRRGSPTEGQAVLVDLSGDTMSALTIPHGVAHGFYFHEPSLHVYAVSEYWDPEDELGCHWRDPGLQIPWPSPRALISGRDEEAPPLRVLLDRLEPWQPIAAGRRVG